MFDKMMSQPDTFPEKYSLAHSAVSYYSHSYNYLVVAIVVVEAEKYR